ncbi:hypothetical protein [Salinisphaera hydrothermalis]|uniref:hypothetical protein n=1 Tax=Salinisphaera hydrothermalis TaxID=563188 RepID=UPI00334241D4
MVDDRLAPWAWRLLRLGPAALLWFYGREYPAFVMLPLGAVSLSGNGALVWQRRLEGTRHLAGWSAA